MDFNRSLHAQLDRGYRGNLSLAADLLLLEHLGRQQHEPGELQLVGRASAHEVDDESSRLLAAGVLPARGPLAGHPGSPTDRARPVARVQPGGRAPTLARH